MNNYEDIINLDRPISKHNHLGMDARAAQFAPFAALTGYDEKIKEAGRITDKKIENNEELYDTLNNKLIFLNEHLEDKIKVNIVYFIKDNKKKGGRYFSKSGIIKRIDVINGFLKFSDNFKVDFEDILDIEYL